MCAGIYKMRECITTVRLAITVMTSSMSVVFFRAVWELNAENMYEVQTDDVTENCWKLHKEEYRCDIPEAIKYEETSKETCSMLGGTRNHTDNCFPKFFCSRFPFGLEK
jgi:hypothetical protein